MSGDDWGPSAPTEIKMNKDEAKNKNLNLLNNEELAAYKKGMDQDFNKNQLKPGDQGFTYDKVVDFSKNNNDEPLEDDSWGEDDGVEEQLNDNENEYYDDEEDEGDELDKFANN